MKRALFIDAMGTMITLLPPWEQAGPELAERVGLDRLRRAFEAEISYYGEHIEEGSTPEELAGLRRRCAEVLSEGAGVEIGVEAMLSAIRFRAFDDTLPALRALRADGLRLVCVSNWDCSLPDLLAELEVAPLLDGIVCSALAGARKPDPRIFAPALEAAGCEPAQALHIGDREEDLRGAAAAGIEALLIDRDGAGGPGAIASLAEIRNHPALRPAPESPASTESR